jgi:TRAP-type C4-dicarboxylate transport system substrate-binding protein
MEMVKTLEKSFMSAIENDKKTSDFRAASASVEKEIANDENPTHREDFNRLLGVAARKPPSKD